MNPMTTHPKQALFCLIAAVTAPLAAQTVLEFPAVLTQPDYPWPVPSAYVIDIESPREFPTHWRITDDPVAQTSKIRSTAGLEKLSAAGSGQFCLDQFYLIQYRLLNRPVTVVDLRAEPHGHVNNMAVTFGDPAALPPDPRRAEARFLKALKAFRNILLPHYAVTGFHLPSAWEPINLRVSVRKIATPEQMVESAHWNYVRLPVQLGHLPGDDVVNRFVSLARRQQPGEWLYIHCDTGRERTTLFLTMLDMMRNSSSVPGDQIVDRQQKLADFNLLGPGGWSGQSPNARFLRAFYAYCLDATPGFQRSWQSPDR